MFENKNILIFGFGVTGKSALRCMSKFTSNLYVYDKNEENLKEDLNISFKNFILEDLDKIDFIVKSPGINPDNEILIRARQKNIKIFSDIEVAYLITKCKHIIAITGTNGKTTTTSIVNEILKRENTTYCVGNIGKGILDIALDAREDEYIVLEASSFQLEDTESFKPEVSAITNITIDHLDWHKTIENYKNAKLKVLKNQSNTDFTILNYRDEYLKSLKFNRDIYYFSLEDANKFGCYVKDGKIYFRDVTFREEEVLLTSDIKIPGSHNVENVLTAVTIAKCLNISNEKIKDAVSNFFGVEHRMEFVKEIKNVVYYNDSKGTNPDSTIMAINAVDDNIILIAGGYDKEADFEEMLKIGKNKIKKLVIYGQTADKIEESARHLNYSIYRVKDLEEAVSVASSFAIKGDTVLFSPACASWDMYSSFEERGRHFKNLVSRL
ncbi:UDP-N-acetylmuramoylalanine--D-glutamate ligase [Anaerosphaera aminiphila DSM 21120]|uniref:UDP-N-acetylmuramoylalanine--D-glutamate ligase n=1 Tax=Anaerosphaera aminiphila DSM 21120 TaxID=1120995 RepID=A0A1M5SZI1_9FIRM|nr:UDP-N-acetylmuramoyl-L-alanine--D-glutamate ligase [Anaerosphaera aminiphila]SHH43563.1 UDP-N-acetylmuramoylalanine--D-glutamate ligase [Anaerosphaera aminiphila DSM 21120]